MFATERVFCQHRHYVIPIVAIGLMVLGIVTPTGCSEEPATQTDTVQTEDTSPDFYPSDQIEEVPLSNDPFVRSLLPRHGGNGGGTVVTIKGSGFTEGVEIFFGSLPAESVEWISAGELSMISPRNQPGYVDVEIKNSNGRKVILQRAFSYSPSNIGWCRLLGEPSVTTTSGTRTDLLQGEAFYEGVTGLGSEEGPLLAEIGYGPVSTSPESELLWNFVPAELIDQIAGTDIYGASLIVETAGSYHYGFRFSENDGINWLYCDLDGNGLNDEPRNFETEQAGILTIE